MGPPMGPPMGGPPPMPPMGPPGGGQRVSYGWSIGGQWQKPPGFGEESPVPGREKEYNDLKAAMATPGDVELADAAALPAGLAEVALPPGLAADLLPADTAVRQEAHD